MNNEDENINATSELFEKNMSLNISFDIAQIPCCVPGSNHAELEKPVVLPAAVLVDNHKTSNDQNSINILNETYLPVLWLTGC